MYAQTWSQLLSSWELLLKELMYSMMSFIPRNIRNIDSFVRLNLKR